MAGSPFGRIRLGGGRYSNVPIPGFQIVKWEDKGCVGPQERDRMLEHMDHCPLRAKLAWTKKGLCLHFTRSNLLIPTLLPSNKFFSSSML